MKTSKARTIRDRLRLEHNPIMGLSIEVARNTSDLKAAYNLVYKSYVEMGYTEESRNEIRLTLQDILPTTTTFVAKIKGRVVGTLRTLQSNSLGLPTANIFDVRETGNSPYESIEISSLAVSKDFRKMGGTILYHLVRTVLLYCQRFTHAHTVIITVNPRHVPLYRDILLFNEFSKSDPSLGCPSANGAPAVGFFFHLKNFESEYHAIYADQSDRKNMHKFIFQLTADPVTWPNRDFYVGEDPVMTPSKLEHFLSFLSESPENMTIPQKTTIRNSYNFFEYRSLFQDFNLPKNLTLRRSQRFKFNGICSIASIKIRLEVTEVSRAGLVVREQLGVIYLPKKISISIDTGPNRNLEVQGEVLRRKSGKIIISVQKPNSKWDEFIDILSHRFLTVNDTEIPIIKKVS